jgi:hypothetical protein
MTTLVLGIYMWLYDGYLHAMNTVFVVLLNLLDRATLALSAWRPGAATLWMSAWWVFFVAITLLKIAAFLVPWFALAWALRASARRLVRAIRTGEVQA